MIKIRKLKQITNLSGKCTISVNKPTYDISVIFGGLPVLDKKGLDGCKAQHIDMPLNMGSVDIPAVQCPTLANQTLTYTSINTVGKLAPNGKLTGTLTAYGDDKKEKIIVADFAASFP